MKTEFANVATQYARAVLDLATEAGGGAAEAVAADLEAINKVVAAVPELQVVLGHPNVPGTEKKKILVDLFQGKVNDLTQRLVELLADKRRFGILCQIESKYRALLNERRNIAEARLTSAEQLSDETVSGIKRKLSTQLGKEIKLDARVDGSLLGGIVLRIGDQVIDGSLRGKLQSLEKSLLSV